MPISPSGNVPYCKHIAGSMPKKCEGILENADKIKNGTMKKIMVPLSLAENRGRTGCLA